MSLRIILFIALIPAIVASSIAKAIFCSTSTLPSTAFVTLFSLPRKSCCAVSSSRIKLSTSLSMVSSQRPSSFSSSTDDDFPDDNTNDWLQAELTLRSFQPNPSPEQTPHEVLHACLRSLQFVDFPAPSAGLERCFPYFTWECRKIITARKGGDTVELFMKYGVLSPALQPFMGATRLDVGGETFTSGSNTRGDIVSYPVTIHGAMALSFQYSSGLIRNGVSNLPPVTHMVVRLEKNRRPPMQNCWLVREVIDVRYAFAGDMGNAHVGA